MPVARVGQAGKTDGDGWCRGGCLGGGNSRDVNVGARISARPRYRKLLAAVDIGGYVRGFVQLKRGFEKLTTEVKAPTSAPPLPWKVKVPPVCGIAVALRVELYAPLIPNCMGSVSESPLGPVSVMVPGSRPAPTPVLAAAVWSTMHPPGETGLPGA